MFFLCLGDNYKNIINFILTEPDLSSNENLIAQATDYIEAALPTLHDTDRYLTVEVGTQTLHARIAKLAGRASLPLLVQIELCSYQNRSRQFQPRSFTLVASGPPGYLEGMR